MQTQPRINILTSLVMILIVIVISGGSAFPAIESHPSRSVIEEMAQLTDKEARTLLMERLASEDRETASQAKGPDRNKAARVFMNVYRATQESFDRLQSIAVETPEHWEPLLAAVSDGRGMGYVLKVLLWLGGIILGGLIAEWGFRRITGEIQTLIITVGFQGLAARITRIVLRILLGVLRIAIYVLTTFALFNRKYDPGRRTQCGRHSLCKSWRFSWRNSYQFKKIAGCTPHYV